MKKTKLFFGFICCLLSIFTVCGALPAKGEDISEIIPFAGFDYETEINYEPIAVNEKFALYADMNTGLFCLENRSTGKKWFSTPNTLQEDERSKAATRMVLRSQLSIECVYIPEIAKTTNTQKVNSSAECLDNNGISIEKINNGIKVTYDFSEYSILIPVNYVLTDNGMYAEIETKNIKDNGKYKLTAINLLPAFAAGGKNDDGYCLIPDGSGALISYNNGKEIASSYNKMVYGEERCVEKSTETGRDEAIYLPVFGICNNGESILAVIESGAANASITAFNANSGCEYTSVSSRFNIRELVQKTMFADTTNRRNISTLADLTAMQENYKVSYFADMGEGGYSAMAARYRDYLIENGKLKKVTDYSSGININIYGLMQTQKQFLGINYKKDIALSTIKDIGKITKGYSGLISDVNYIGWQKGGSITAEPFKNIKFSGVAGKKSDWEDAQKALYSEAARLNLYIDVLKYKKSASKYAVKDIYNSKIMSKKYLRSVYSEDKRFDEFYYINPFYVNDLTNKYASFAKKSDIKSVTVSGITNNCYSSHSDKKEFLRSDFPECVSESLKKFVSDGINVNAVGASEYTFKYVSKIFEAPMTSGSNTVFDIDVPFYQMVLHGYIPLTTGAIYQESEPDIAFLKAVETGTEPLYSMIYKDSSVLIGSEYEELYSSNYKLLKDEITEKNSRYCVVLEKISSAEIKSHCYEKSGVSHTEYENGIQIYVNYNDSAVTVGDITVPAKDYIVIGG